MFTRHTYVFKPAWLAIQGLVVLMGFVSMGAQAEVQDTMEAYRSPSSTSTADIAAVTSEQELLDAVRKGKAHIELRDHIFLTQPTLDQMPLGIVPDTVKTFRGNCSHLPLEKGWRWKGQAKEARSAATQLDDISLHGPHLEDIQTEEGDEEGDREAVNVPFDYKNDVRNATEDTEAPGSAGSAFSDNAQEQPDVSKARYESRKLPLVPYQCVITTSQGLMVVGGRLWMDGIYVRRRSHRLARPGARFTAIRVTGAGELYMTDVTIQGDKRAVTQALRVDSKAMAKGGVIADHRGSNEVSPVNVTLGATLSLLDTTVMGTDSSRKPGTKKKGDVQYGAAITAYTASKVRLQGLNLTDNAVAHDLENVPDPSTEKGTLPAAYYTDHPKVNLVFWKDQSQDYQSHSLSSIPLASPFLGLQDPWLRWVQQEVERIPRVLPPPTPSPSQPSHSLDAPPADESSRGTALTTAETFQDVDEVSKEAPMPPTPRKFIEVQVRTKEQLKRAMWNGATHIVLLKHLDLTFDRTPAALGIVPQTLRSIRGNCSCLPTPSWKWADMESVAERPCVSPKGDEEPGVAPPLPLKPRQCLIEVSRGALRVVGRLQLEGLYFQRNLVSADAKDLAQLIQVHGAGELYMKDVTLQGTADDYTSTQALTVASKSFGTGVVIAHLGGSQSTVRVSTAATLSLVDTCAHGNAVTGVTSALVEADEQAKVRLQGFTTQHNEVIADLQTYVEHAAADGTFFYSDTVRKFCGMDARGCWPLPMKPVQAVPNATAFLTASDPWLAETRHGVPDIPREDAPTCQDGGYIYGAVMWLCNLILGMSLLEALITLTVVTVVGATACGCMVQKTAGGDEGALEEEERFNWKWFRTAARALHSGGAMIKRGIRRVVPGAAPGPRRAAGRGRGVHIEEVFDGDEGPDVWAHTRLLPGPSADQPPSECKAPAAGTGGDADESTRAWDLAVNRASLSRLKTQQQEVEERAAAKAQVPEHSHSGDHLAACSSTAATMADAAGTADEDAPEIIDVTEMDDADGGSPGRGSSGARGAGPREYGRHSRARSSLSHVTVTSGIRRSQDN